MTRMTEASVFFLCLWVGGNTTCSTFTEKRCANKDAEEAEVERFYEDLQELLELTSKKDVLFIIGDWNVKVGSQETPGVTGKFGLGV